MVNVRAVLQEVFREVFDDPTLEIRDDMDSSSIEDWDSLRHINMIVAAEKALGIRLTTAEISRSKQAGGNLGSFISLLERKVAAGDQGVRK
jgi:acyl carrier protein